MLKITLKVRAAVTTAFQKASEINERLFLIFRELHVIAIEEF